MVTRADVAKHAGVAPSTVSNAMAGSRLVAADTRAKVLAAAQELGYRPNELAQGLAGGRSKVIAMPVPTTARSVTAADLDYLLGAADAAAELAYQVLLLPTNEQEMSYGQRLRAGGLIAGVILTQVRLEDERVGYLQAAGLPFAMVGRTAAPSGLLYADRDFEQDGRAAVAHLTALGHRRIAFLSGSQTAFHGGHGAVVRSVAAVEVAARAAGVELEVIHCDFTVAAGRAAMTRLRVTSPQVTAVICANEQATYGLFHAAAELGVRLPADLSVLSISASEERATYFAPGLTTISPPAAEIGAAAARALIRALKTSEPSAAVPSLWAGQLVERGSTAPAAH
ncbi:MAG: LacI family DNA-binding transcriptional regulator [Candidatus Nanopelagicales bacterium]